MSVQSPTERRRRSDGERSRRAILDAAARQATVEGIDGLSIGGSIQRLRLEFDYVPTPEELTSAQRSR